MKTKHEGWLTALIIAAIFGVYVWSEEQDRIAALQLACVYSPQQAVCKTLPPLKD